MSWGLNWFVGDWFDFSVIIWSWGWWCCVVVSFFGDWCVEEMWGGDHGVELKLSWLWLCIGRLWGLVFVVIWMVVNGRTGLIVVILRSIRVDDLFPSLWVGGIWGGGVGFVWSWFVISCLIVISWGAFVWYVFCGQESVVILNDSWDLGDLHCWVDQSYEVIIVEWLWFLILELVL